MIHLLKTILKLHKKGYRQGSSVTCGPASMIIAGTELGFEMISEAEWSNARFENWVPINQFLSRGMALHELQFTSELIYGKEIEIKALRAYPENFTAFIEDIKTSFQNNNSVVIVNYLQDDFIPEDPCPDGSPHYSPIAGLDDTSNRLLIADICMTVDNTYWVEAKELFQSMSKLNPSFNIPRGWLVIRKRYTGNS